MLNERTGERSKKRTIEDLNPAEKIIFTARAYKRVLIALQMGSKGQLRSEEALQLAIGTGSRSIIEEDINTYDPTIELGAEANYDNPTFRLIMLYLRLPRNRYARS